MGRRARAGADSPSPSLGQADASRDFTSACRASELHEIFDITAATDPSEPQLFDGAGTPNSHNNPQSAYDDTVASGYANKIRITSQQAPAQGREGTNFTTSYMVTNTTSLVFVIPDYALGDNNGGVSVVVTHAVPELGASALLAAGLSAGGLGNGGGGAAVPWRR